MTLTSVDDGGEADVLGALGMFAFLEVRPREIVARRDGGRNENAALVTLKGLYHPQAHYNQKKETTKVN